MEQYHECLKPDCMRKVPPGVAYCCEPCRISAENGVPPELGPYDPHSHWLRVHSEFCEDRKGERGD